eukprot:5902384-Lingulodinium_polyedra.AAC.1
MAQAGLGEARDHCQLPRGVANHTWQTAPSNASAQIAQRGPYNGVAARLQACSLCSGGGQYLQD